MNTYPPDTEQTIVHVIDDYRCGDFRTVEIIVSGFAFDVENAVQLINAAPELYAALDSAIDYVCKSVLPSTRSPETVILIENMQRAAAAARGGILQRDRRVTHGS